MYRRETPTEEYSAKWLQEELNKIEQAFRQFNYLQLDSLFVEPEKPRDGLTVVADGTAWNPGSGQGVYTYYNGAWHKLG